MSLLRPNRRKGRKPDKAYLAFIRSQWCAVCELDKAELVRSGFPVDLLHQRTETEAAHVGERGLGQKSTDRDTIPLCVLHHREGPESHHVLGKNFWKHHKLNKLVLLSELQKEFDRQRANAAV